MCTINEKKVYFIGRRKLKLRLEYARSVLRLEILVS